jgi:hypothetical protein
VPLLSFESAGLICCVLGATILLRAFAFASFAEMALEPHAQKETVQSVMHTLCAQRVDARFGAPLLILGFGLQLFSALHIGEKPLAMLLVLAAIAVAVLYYSLMRDLFATDAASAVLTEKEAAREGSRKLPKLIEAKLESPIEAPHFDMVETAAGT